jgi:hypothetical protein
LLPKYDKPLLKITESERGSVTALFSMTVGEVTGAGAGGEDAHAHKKKMINNTK